MIPAVMVIVSMTAMMAMMMIMSVIAMMAVMVIAMMVVMVIVSVTAMMVVMVIIMMMVPVRFVPVIAMMIVVMMLVVVVMMAVIVRVFQRQNPISGVTLLAAHNHAQHIGLVGQIPCTRPVSDRFHRHGRKARGKMMDGSGDHARSRWRGQFHVMARRGDGKSAHHFQGCRSGHRINAVIATDRA